MAIDVYWSSGSCPSWRVLFALELKQLAYESHVLERSKREHKTAEMLARNPRGRVPVLVDGATTLYESMAIIAYLDRKYPERPLLGRTPEETGLIWRLYSECVCYLEPAIDRVCLPIYGGKAAEKAEQVRAAAFDVSAELAPLEERLARAPWLCGDEATAADAAYVPQIGHLLRALGKPGAADLDLDVAPFPARFPALAAWWERVRAVPGFERTYPPHWR